MFWLVPANAFQQILEVAEEEKEKAMLLLPQKLVIPANILKENKKLMLQRGCEIYSMEEGK